MLPEYFSVNRWIKIRPKFITGSTVSLIWQGYIITEGLIVCICQVTGIVTLKSETKKTKLIPRKVVLSDQLLTPSV